MVIIHSLCLVPGLVGDVRGCHTQHFLQVSNRTVPHSVPLFPLILPLPPVAQLPRATALLGGAGVLTIDQRSEP